jgi:hypothetical protein
MERSGSLRWISWSESEPGKSAPKPSEPHAAYIRGAAVVPLDGRRLRRRLIAVGLTALAVVTLILTMDATRSALTIHRLNTRGQAVTVTVTGCLGLASGTGITPVGYTCRGTFALQGRTHQAVIRGTSSQYQIGQTLTGITDPRSPETLFTPQSLATAPAAWQHFILPAALFGLLLLCSAFAFAHQPSSSSGRSGSSNPAGSPVLAARSRSVANPMAD